MGARKEAGLSDIPATARAAGGSDGKSEIDAGAWLAAIVENSDDAILSKTLDGIITSWNRGAADIFGYSTEEAVGRSVTMLIPQERFAEEAEFMRVMARGERVRHFETERIRKDGRRIHVSVSLSPIRAGAGSLIGVSSISRDITEAKRREAVRAALARRSAEYPSPLWG